MGVIAGVAVAWITGWERLDGAVALAVAVNIVATGAILIRRSTGGLMDKALDESHRAVIATVLSRFEETGIQFHALRTRQAGRRSFVSVHVLVPGNWTVHRGHDLAEEVEARIRVVLPDIVVFTHIEPADDPRSQADRSLDPNLSSV